MASVPRSAWIQLYKDLQRAAAQFPQYNYRNFFKRRIRDHFSLKSGTNSTLSQVELFERERKLLGVIHRQITIYRLYPTPESILEKKPE
uniref:Complex1_LYR_dom domain-containing protein n=1 Tax=Syphacia muris TaxID=451379 RepID=A0A0N5B0K6_9BILA